MHKLCIVNPKNVPNGTLSEHNHAIYLRETFFELIPGKVIIFHGVLRLRGTSEFGFDIGEQGPHLSTSSCVLRMPLTYYNKVTLHHCVVILSPRRHYAVDFASVV